MGLIPNTNENFYELAWNVRNMVCDQFLQQTNDLNLILNSLVDFEVKNEVQLGIHGNLEDGVDTVFFTGQVQVLPRDISGTSDKVTRTVHEVLNRMELIASHVDSRTQAVVELGCGYGPNLFRLAEILKRDDIQYIGAEYTESGRTLFSKLLNLDNAPSIQIEYVDHKNLELPYLDEYDDIVLFTCHSIEQVKELPENYFEILARSAAHVRAIHIEPFGFQVDNASPASQKHEEWFRSRGYNLNFYERLRAAEQARLLTVLDVQKDVYGLQDGNPSSIAVWDNIFP